MFVFVQRGIFPRFRRGGKKRKKNRHSRHLALPPPVCGDLLERAETESEIQQDHPNGEKRGRVAAIGRELAGNSFSRGLRARVPERGSVKCTCSGICIGDSPEYRERECLGFSPLVSWLPVSSCQSSTRQKRDHRRARYSETAAPAARARALNESAEYYRSEDGTLRIGAGESTRSREPRARCLRSARDNHRRSLSLEPLARATVQRTAVLCNPAINPADCRSANVTVRDGHYGRLLARASRWRCARFLRNRRDNRAERSTSSHPRDEKKLRCTRVTYEGEGRRGPPRRVIDRVVLIGSCSTRFPRGSGARALRTLADR